MDRAKRRKGEEREYVKKRGDLGRSEFGDGNSWSLKQLLGPRIFRMRGRSGPCWGKPKHHRHGVVIQSQPTPFRDGNSTFRLMESAVSFC
jgi:hypothetical protein